MPQSSPSILIILADDVGWSDPSCYHQGLMGTRTPNIDRSAAEGARLTDCYAQASCTAGRAALITGQLPMRTGLTTVGMPGAPQGIQAEDPTLADLIRPQGYLTLGTLDELGITKDSVVIFTTDNGAEKFSSPDGGTSPFRSERGLGWEGASERRSRSAGPATFPKARSSTASSRLKTSCRP